MDDSRGRAPLLMRVVDDHNFTHDPAQPSCCRVQLFVGEGYRPVAIATQTMPPQGCASLTNAAERLAAEAWRRYLPESPEPPRWIEHYIFAEGSGLLAGEHKWREVTFEQDSAGGLQRPKWRRIDLDKLTALAGPIDVDRGDQYTPPPPPPPEEPQVLQFYRVARLPLPEPFRADACMPTGRGNRGRLIRQLLPQRPAQDCCWYHSGDWRQVTQMLTSATGLHKPGQQLELTDDLRHELIDRIKKRTPPGSWLREAATSLLIDPIVIYIPTEEGWINGQHRGQAMLDAGVRFTLLETVPWD